MAFRTVRKPTFRTVWGAVFPTVWEVFFRAVRGAGFRAVGDLVLRVVREAGSGAVRPICLGMHSSPHGAGGVTERDPIPRARDITRFRCGVGIVSQAGTPVQGATGY
jgi:hypothetical protein